MIKKNKNYSEYPVHTAFVKYVKFKYPHIDLIHIPNGEKRDMITAMKLKLMGVMRGVPDLFFPSLKLWVELKSVKGKLSREQTLFIENRQKEGYSVIIAYGYRL